MSRHYWPTEDGLRHLVEHKDGRILGGSIFKGLWYVNGEEWTVAMLEERGYLGVRTPFSEEAERAELRAENERLRERVRELARGKLQRIISDDADAMFPRGSRGWWSVACDERSGAWLMRLAEEAGVWFDDDGSEVALDEWRERIGGETA